MDKTYTDGLNDAWELAKKLYNMTCSEIEKIFDVRGGFYEVIRDFTPQEALAMIETYEQSKEIKVGDVVEQISTGRHFLIITEEEYDMYKFGVIDLNEMRIDRICNDTRHFKRTGKHIDINSVLEQLKGE